MTDERTELMMRLHGLTVMIGREFEALRRASHQGDDAARDAAQARLRELCDAGRELSDRLEGVPL